jgi:predicted nucleic acid-binding protein
MKRQRIYIDTSVVGGFFDEKFEKETRLLFKRLDNKEVVFVISEVLTGELENAPEWVRTLLDNYSDDNFERVPLTDEARELADNYIAENVVGKTSYNDCCHIALATIHRVDVLASWNFRHIVNLTRIRGYNGVNLKNGYTTLEIRNPKELIDYGKDI